MPRAHKTTKAGGKPSVPKGKSGKKITAAGKMGKKGRY